MIAVRYLNKAGEPTKRAGWVRSDLLVRVEIRDAGRVKDGYVSKFSSEGKVRGVLLWPKDFELAVAEKEFVEAIWPVGEGFAHGFVHANAIDYICQAEAPEDWLGDHADWFADGVAYIANDFYLLHPSNFQVDKSRASTH